MKNYIQEWIHGVEPEPTTAQLSARVDIHIAKKVDEISAEFGVTRTNVIEAALDYGTEYLLEEIQKMNKDNVDMIGRMAKEQGKEKEFKEMIKGGKEDA